jgi:hypothetical protein
MAAKRHLVRLNRIAQSAIIAGALIAANVVAQRWFSRWDLTERREYSLSPATKKRLPGWRTDRPTPTSRDPPPYLGTSAGGPRRLKSTGHADGRLTSSPRTARPGILRFSSRRSSATSSRSRPSARRHCTAGSRRYPGHRVVGHLEYELTSALLRLTARPETGFADAPKTRGRKPIRAGNSAALRAADIGAAGLTNAGDVATSPSPTPELDEPARYAVDQFIMRGGARSSSWIDIEIPGGRSRRARRSPASTTVEHYGSGRA